MNYWEITKVYPMNWIHHNKNSEENSYQSMYWNSYECQNDLFVPKIFRAETTACRNIVSQSLKYAISANYGDAMHYIQNFKVNSMKNRKPMKMDILIWLWTASVIMLLENSIRKIKVETAVFSSRIFSRYHVFAFWQNRTGRNSSHISEAV